MPAQDAPTLSPGRAGQGNEVYIDKRGKGGLMGRLFRTSLSAASIVAAGPALAHHVMDGAMPRTAAEGFLSGLAHPVIGPDHLAFVVGIGILSAFVTRGWLLPGIFLVAGAVGTALHLASLDLTGGEALVLASVVLMAGAVALHRRTPATLIALVCCLGGLAHGYALAESIVGAEPSPLWAYFAGLVIVQLAISLAVRELVRRLVDGRPAIPAQLAYAASAAILVVGVAVPLLLA
jgi:urease accessory protein